MKKLVLMSLMLVSSYSFAECKGEPLKKLVDVCGKPSFQKVSLTQTLHMTRNMGDLQQSEEKKLSMSLYINDQVALKVPSLEAIALIQQAIITNKDVCVKTESKKILDYGCSIIDSEITLRIVE